MYRYSQLASHDDQSSAVHQLNCVCMCVCVSVCVFVYVCVSDEFVRTTASIACAALGNFHCLQHSHCWAISAFLQGFIAAMILLFQHDQHLYFSIFDVVSAGSESEQADCGVSGLRAS